MNNISSQEKKEKDKQENKLPFFRSIIAKYRYNRLKRVAEQARKYLRSIDETMAAMGMPRRERRQYWRDFFKYEQLRAESLKSGGK